MKKLKKILALVSVCLMSISMASCANTNIEQTQVTTTAKETTSLKETTLENTDKTTVDKEVSIGILQLIDHEALNGARDGFIASLKDAGYIEGENLTLDIQNAQGDQSNLKSMSQRFVNNNVDLILAISTPAAQSVASETTSIPILVTAVTDLVDAKLVDNNEKPGANITGTNDMNPIKDQIDLLKKLVPEAKTIGLLYTSGEPNSSLQADIAKSVAKELELEVIEKTVTTSNDVQQVAQSLVNKVDAIYIPTDNILASSMPMIADIAKTNKMPVICGEPNMVKSGGLATIGIDYYKLGYQTGNMAIRILKGEDVPADMPVESLKDMEYVINGQSANDIEITIPEDLKKYIFVE